MHGLVGLAFIRPHATLDVAGMQMDKNALGCGRWRWRQHPAAASHRLARRLLRRIRTFKDMSLGMFNKEAQLDMLARKRRCVAEVLADGH